MTRRARRLNEKGFRTKRLDISIDRYSFTAKINGSRSISCSVRREVAGEIKRQRETYRVALLFDNGLFVRIGVDFALAKMSR